MKYVITSFVGINDFKFNIDLSEAIDLLESPYDLTQLGSNLGTQLYFPDLAIKILFDIENKLKGLFIYNESREFHTVDYKGENLLELDYKTILRKFNSFTILEDLETLIVLDLGITFYFQDDKKDNPYPEEVGVFREDLKSFYIKAYR